MLVKNEVSRTNKQFYLPEKIVESYNVENPEGFLENRPLAPRFIKGVFPVLRGKGAYVVFDFGIEVCGYLRFIVDNVDKNCTHLRLTFGESLSEAMSEIGYKNAKNDHAPRDEVFPVSAFSDLNIGNTAFRFVKVEMVDDWTAKIQNIFAVCETDYMENESTIKTNDERLNKILDTAKYTMRLCIHNGYIMEGAKRDRLIWAGDFHQEVLTSMYAFGAIENVPFSLDVLREGCPTNKWMNNIPNYSAWWIITLYEYVRLSGDTEYMKKNKDFSKFLVSKFNDSLRDDGKLDYSTKDNPECLGMMPYFIDWPTRANDNSLYGSYALLIIMADRYEEMFGKDEMCERIRKLSGKFLEKELSEKQLRAIQILAGKVSDTNLDTLESGDAKGFSTFMAYYILTAMSKLNSNKPLDIIKTYFGAMLDKGATTFFEDFDMDWVDGTSTIYELPKEGEKDIHGDFGNYCYKGLRHSLCHAWSSGVYAYFVENIIGLTTKDGYKTVTIKPNLMGLKTIDARITTPMGYLEINIDGEKVTVNAPDGITVKY